MDKFIPKIVRLISFQIINLFSTSLVIYIIWIIDIGGVLFAVNSYVNVGYNNLFQFNNHQIKVILSIILIN
jgi:hypothetical protein